MNFYRPISEEAEQSFEEQQMDDVIVPQSDQSLEADPLASTTPTKKKYAGATGPRCFVKNCPNTTKKRDEEGLDISFHRFPRDPVLQRIWIKRCCSGRDAKLANRFVCSIHFEPLYFSKQHKPGSKRKILAHGVPTLFLPISDEMELDSPIDRAGSPERAPSPGDTSMNAAYEQDIEMVELSSEEETVDITSPPPPRDSSSLSTADVLAAATALQNPRPPPPQLQNTKVLPKKVLKTPKPAKKSPVKSFMGSKESSLDGSIYSDDECEEEDFSLEATEELDYLDLQDPLEQSYQPWVWKNMNEKSRRATLRAYFSRLASYIPPRFPRCSKTAILLSAMQYLDDITKDNAVLAVEEEILMQRHYKLRKTKGKLDRAKKLNISG